MLGLKLNHVSKRCHWWLMITWWHKEPGHQHSCYWPCFLGLFRPQDQKDKVKWLGSMRHVILWPSLRLLFQYLIHYNDVIMSAIVSQITSLTVVYSTVYSGADKRKHHSSALLAFVRGIHRWPVNSPHKGPVTRKILPFDDVIMIPYKSPRNSLIKVWVPISNSLAWTAVNWTVCVKYSCSTASESWRWPLLLTRFNFKSQHG